MKTVTKNEALQLVQEHKIIQQKLDKANQALKPFTSEQIRSLMKK